MRKKNSGSLKKKWKRKGRNGSHFAHTHTHSAKLVVRIGWGEVFRFVWSRENIIYSVPCFPDVMFEFIKTRFIVHLFSCSEEEEADCCSLMQALFHITNSLYFLPFALPVVIEYIICYTYDFKRRNITLFVHICIHIHVIKQMIKPKYLCQFVRLQSNRHYKARVNDKWKWSL